MKYLKAFKYMGDSGEIQDEFYDVLNNCDPNELEDFFQNNIVDEERFQSYMPKGGSLKGFVKYLLKNRIKPKNKPKTDYSKVKTLEDLYLAIKAAVENSELKEYMYFTDKRDKDQRKSSDADKDLYEISFDGKNIEIEGVNATITFDKSSLNSPFNYETYDYQNQDTAAEIMKIVMRRLKNYILVRLTEMLIFQKIPWFFRY